MIKALVIARSNKGTFLVEPENGKGYSIFTLDGFSDVNLGDELFHPSWTDSEGLFTETKNKKKDLEFRICIENWQCGPKPALKTIWRIGRADEVRFLTGFDKAFIPYFDDI